MTQNDSPSTTPRGSGAHAGDPASLENLPWTGITVVVAVLGLLLFMAVPMRKPTAHEALRAQRERQAFVALDTLSKAIEDYHADHAEWPGAQPLAASGLGPLVHEESWLRRQLEMPSNRTGDTLPDSSADYSYGPYLPKGIPTNPLNRQDSIRILREGESIDSVVDGLYGWVYDPRSGEVQPHVLPFQQLPSRRGRTHRAGSFNRK